MSVPRDFHFVFGLRPQDEPFHLVYYLCLASCIAVNRPDRVRLYYHHEPWGPWWDRIRDSLELVQVPLVPEVSGTTYDDPLVKRFAYAHHADFIRVQKLLEHGGVYADIDTLFVRPYPDVLFAHPYVMGVEDDVFDPRTQSKRPSVCNAVIFSEKDAAFGERWLARMPEALDGTWSNHSCFLARELADAHPEWIHLEPKQSFYGYSWTREDLRRLFVEPPTAGDTRGIYSMHLWNHLWWDRDRRDFLRFHEGVLTEDFIRRVDTPYNVLARRFLPTAPAPPAAGRWAATLRHGLRRIAERVDRLR